MFNLVVFLENKFGVIYLPMLLEIRLFFLKELKLELFYVKREFLFFDLWFSIVINLWHRKMK